MTKLIVVFHSFANAPKNAADLTGELLTSRGADVIRVYNKVLILSGKRKLENRLTLV